MAEIKEEIMNFITKGWALLLYLFIGLIGKFSYDMASGKKMSWVQVLSSIGIGIFVGALTYTICIHQKMDKEASIIVPISTLLSEKIMVALFSIDYKKIAADMADYFSNKLKK